MSKHENMLAILWALSSETPITAKMLAERLEVNIRSVYRYIDALCASGVPIVADSGHHGGYRLLHPSTFAQPPLLLDAADKLSLLQAADLAYEAGYPAVSALKRAASKLKTYTNEAQSDLLNRRLQGSQVVTEHSPSVAEATFAEFETSSADQYSLDIQYRKPNALQTSERRIDPYGSVYWNRRWYVVAYCHWRSDIRLFRMDRISDIRRTEHLFIRPPGFSARQFLLEKLLPEPVNEQTDLVLVIEGRFSALEDLCRHWLMSACLVELSENQAYFRMDEDFIRKYVPYLLLPYGTSIKAVEPSFLKEELQEILSKLLLFYND
ncbi:helix-turn-helix transcriptional regulator [Saccharibacillus kuerlensis]|uniref:DNA-binding transcriptional regulator n=1 Tax=Saccharibacillus kuerlensis TaxID=459527 RepID=A0ABQ2L3V2_9BACL|nr:WYL domain-containing protein [Saccharibacillus kuerlensis]GGO01691.1 DNA-binding transcriptional regulator [Saccharibacillus kuerlensis]